MSAGMTNGQQGIGYIARALKSELLKIGEIIGRMSSGILVNVTPENIAEIVAKNKTVVLLFTADWCGRCVTMQSVLMDIASKTFKDDIVFGVVDVDKSYSLAERYAVQHIPTVLIIDDGKVVDVIVGSTSKEKLVERLKKFLDRK